MTNRSEYLVHLYNLIDHEFFILENSSEYQDSKQLLSLKKMWEEKKVEELDETLSNLFMKRNLAFIVPEESEEEENYEEIIILRLFSLVSITTDILEVIQDIEDDEIYQRLVLRYPNSEVDFTEIAALTRVAKLYLQEFKSFLELFTPPTPLRMFYKHLVERIQMLLEVKTIEGFYRELYDFFEYINSFLDGMEGQEFDWEDEEIFLANSLFSWILFVESSLYYLLLLKETYLSIQEEKTHEVLQEILDVSSQREDVISELKIIQSLDEYPHKTEKN